MEPNEIVMRTLRDQGGDVDYRTVLPAIVAKSGMKNADSVQIGNSFFVYYRKKNAVLIEGYVQDTGREAFKNQIKFLWHLQKEGVTHATVLADPSQVRMMEVIKKYFQGTDTFVGIGRPREDGSQLVLIRIGEDKIKRL